MLQPKPKFTPPSDAVVVESESNFVPPSDAVVLKKKESTESTSTIQESNGDSVQKIGSSGTVGSNGFPAIDQNLGVPGLKPDLKTVDQLANPPKSKSTIQSIEEFKKTSEKEDDSFFDYLKENLDTGLATVSKSIYDTPALLYDTAASITNPVFKALTGYKGEDASSKKLAED